MASNSVIGCVLVVFAMMHASMAQVCTPPCAANGRCIPGEDDDAICFCLDGWSGVACDVAPPAGGGMVECMPPCQNGGVCTSNADVDSRANKPLETYYGRCECPAEYEGDVCEIAKCTSVSSDGVAVKGMKVTGPAMSVGSMELNTIPFGFVGGNVYVPKLPVSEYPQLKLTCCGSYSCAFFITLYRCPSCKPHDGGLSEVLLKAGWSTASCSPKFVHEYYSHPMHTFRTKLEGGESVTLEGFDDDLNFIAVFESTTFTTDYWCPRPRGPAYRENTCMKNCAIVKK